MSSQGQSLQEFQRGLVAKIQEIIERVASDLSYFSKHLPPSVQEKPTLNELVAEAKAKPKEADSPPQGKPNTTPVR